MPLWFLEESSQYLYNIRKNRLGVLWCCNYNAFGWFGGIFFHWRFSWTMFQLNLLIWWWKNTPGVFSSIIPLLPQNTTLLSQPMNHPHCGCCFPNCIGSLFNTLNLYRVESICKNRFRLSQNEQNCKEQINSSKLNTGRSWFEF